MTAYITVSAVFSAVAATWAFDPKRRAALGTRVGGTKPKRPPH